MPYFPDLTPCTYFRHWQDRLIAISWLNVANEYQKGDVPEEFYKSLVALLKKPWQPFLFLGGEFCSFCLLTHERSKVRISVDNLFVPGKNQVYVAPSMITHYIDSHGYQPPLEFQEALMLAAGTSRAIYNKKIRAILKD
jgi:hypothetical protein